MAVRIRCELTDEQLRYGAHEDLQNYSAEMAEELLHLRAKITELKAAATEALDAWADEVGLVANQDNNYNRLRAVVARDEP